MRSIFKVLVLLGIVGCAAATTAAAQADPYAGFEPALKKVLQRFDEAQAGVSSLAATFTERKEIGLLKNAVVQKGEFFHTKPDKFLWEYVAPEPKMLLMNGKSLVAYYPVQKEAEEIQTRLSRRLVKYFGLGQVFVDLQEYYELSLGRDDGSVPNADLIVMKPRRKALEKRLMEVRLWIDRDLNQVRRLEYREQDGDRTVYSFETIRVNPPIAPDRYEINLPADVKVTDSFSGFFAEKGR